MIKLIGQFLKILWFFLGLWKEQDRDKAEEKAKIAKEIIDALKEPKPKMQAAHLNVVISRIDRMRS